jgi:hypothetical protein
LALDVRALQSRKVQKDHQLVCRIRAETAGLFESTGQVLLIASVNTVEERKTDI